MHPCRFPRLLTLSVMPQVRKPSSAVTSLSGSGWARRPVNCMSLQTHLTWMLWASIAKVHISEANKSSLSFETSEVFQARLFAMAYCGSSWLTLSDHKMIWWRLHSCRITLFTGIEHSAFVSRSATLLHEQHSAVQMMNESIYIKILTVSTWCTVYVGNCGTRFSDHEWYQHMIRHAGIINRNIFWWMICWRDNRIQLTALFMSWWCNSMN